MVRSGKFRVVDSNLNSVYGASLIYPACSQTLEMGWDKRQSSRIAACLAIQNFQC